MDQNNAASCLGSEAFHGGRETVERFEAAWLAGQRPSLDDYLPASTEPRRPILLRDLVHVELELRLKAGEAARVETYLSRYPELAANETAVTELICREYALRLQREPDLAYDEYRKRFPEHAANLLRTLQCLATLEPPITRAPLWSSGASTTSASYHLLKLHDRGGVGEVYVAHDARLHRDVALKKLRPERANDADSRRRFLVEAEVTGRLQHPGVVPVYALADDEGGQPCYAMRFIEGESLKEAIDRFHLSDKPGRDPAQRALEFRQLLTRFVTVCNTVAYAHSRGIIHRDIKPANIMLGRYGETLLVDWGLAKALGRSEETKTPSEETLLPISASDQATATGEVFGTPAYMSPEQAAGRWSEVGTSSDIYSLGATLYSLLTGQPPFRGGEVFARAEQPDFPPPRQVKKEIAPGLEAICLKAMAARPQDRYPSAASLAADMENWLGGQPVSARAEPLPERLWRWCGRHRVFAGSVLASALAVLVTSGVALILTANVKAENGRLALLRTFAAELDREEWSVRHCAELESLAEDLTRLSSWDGVAAREELYSRFATAIEKKLSEPGLQGDDYRQIEGEIERLKSARADLGEKVYASYQRRHGAPENFSLEPPYSQLATFFDPSIFRMADNCLAPNIAKGNVALIATRLTCPGDGMIDAIFKVESWQEPRQLALYLNLVRQDEARGQMQAYAFVLQAAPEPTAGGRKPSATEREMRLQIRHTGTVLREQAVRLGRNRFRLTATREARTLTFRLDDSPPLVINDIFPMSYRDTALFALELPQGLAVEHLALSRRRAPPMPRRLQAADDLYVRSDYALALEHYQELEGTGSAELQQEIRCKKALSLMQLGRMDEAGRLFEQVSLETGKEWPIVAACQLWLIHLKRKEFEQTNAILTRLVERYSPEEIAPIVLSDVVQRIFSAYPKLQAYDFIIYNPRRIPICQTRDAVLHLFQAPAKMQFDSRMELIQAYHVDGQLGTAIAIANELLQDAGLRAAWRARLVDHLSWLWLEQGDCARALKELDRWLQPDSSRPGTGPAAGAGVRYPKDYLTLLPQRASVLYHLRRGDEAARTLADYFAQVDPSDPNFCRACLVEGFLREEKGDVAGGQQSWTRGYRRGLQANELHTLDVSILASLTGLLSDEEAARLIAGVLGPLPANNPFSRYMVSWLLDPPQYYPVLREMYHSGRGHKLARDIAFLNLPANLHLSVQIRLFVAEVVHHLALPGPLSPEQDDLIWDFVMKCHEIHNQGRLSLEAVGTLAVAFVGDPARFGDGKLYDAGLRGYFAYFGGLRCKRLKRLKESAELFQSAVANSEPTSALHRMAAAEWEKAKASAD